MTFDWDYLTISSDETTEGAGQDQIARMCLLILLYTLRKNKSIIKKSRINIIDCKKNQRTQGPADMICVPTISNLIYV